MDPRSWAVARTVLVNMAPACVVVLASILFALAKFFPKPTSTRWPSVPELTSSLFAVFALFFITIADSAINTGMARLAHPNGQASLQAFPFILTTDDAAQTILAVSIVGTVVWCIGGLVLVVAALQKARTNKMNLKYHRSTLALKIRYREEVSWWCVAILIQNLLVALTVSLFEDGGWQTTFIGSVLVIYVVALASFKPYYSPLVHYCDLTSSVGKVLLMMVAPIYKTTGQGAPIFVIIVSLCYVPCLFFVLWATYLMLQLKFNDDPSDLSLVCPDLGGRVAEKVFPSSGKTFIEVARVAAEDTEDGWVVHRKFENPTSIAV